MKPLKHIIAQVLSQEFPAEFPAEFLLVCVEMEKYIIERFPEHGLGFSRAVRAQMCHESNYGHSELATHHNNFAGLKYRPELRGWQAVQYTDWQGKTDWYFACEKPEDFPALYFAFLARSIYAGWQKFVCQGRGFILHLEKCRWCGATPGEKSYSEKIFDLMASKKFKRFLFAIKQYGYKYKKQKIPQIVESFGENDRPELAGGPEKGVSMSLWTEIRDKVLRPALIEFVTIRIGGQRVKVERLVRTRLREYVAEKLGLQEQLRQQGRIIEGLQDEIGRLRDLLAISEDIEPIPEAYDFEEF